MLKFTHKEECGWSILCLVKQSTSQHPPFVCQYLKAAKLSDSSYKATRELSAKTLQISRRQSFPALSIFEYQDWQDAFGAMSHIQGWNEAVYQLQKEERRSPKFSQREFFDDFLAFAREFEEFDTKRPTPQDDTGIGPITYNFTIKARHSVCTSSLVFLSALVKLHKELADIILDILAASRYDTWEGDVPSFLPALERSAIRAMLQEYVIKLISFSHSQLG